MTEARTCAEAMNEAAAFLAQYYAIAMVRPPTAKERAAAGRARHVVEGYGLTIPDGLK